MTLPLRREDPRAKVTTDENWLCTQDLTPAKQRPPVRFCALRLGLFRHPFRDNPCSVLPSPATSPST